MDFLVCDDGLWTQLGDSVLNTKINEDLIQTNTGQTSYTPYPLDLDSGRCNTCSRDDEKRMVRLQERPLENVGCVAVD